MFVWARRALNGRFRHFFPARAVDVKGEFKAHGEDDDGGENQPREFDAMDEDGSTFVNPVSDSTPHREQKRTRRRRRRDADADIMRHNQSAVYR
jgi:hypothetical protein